MKVLHVGQLHKADDIRIFQKECRSLAKAGYAVTYCTSDYQGDEVGVKNIDGVRVQVYPYRKKKQEGHWVIRLFQILYNRTTRPLGLYKTIVDSIPDIVHIHEHRLAYLVFALRWKIKKVIIIYDAHEDSAYEKYENETEKYGVFTASILAKMRGFIEHQACKCADVVVAATPHIEELLAPYSKKIVTVKNYPIISHLPSYERKGADRPKT